MAESNKIRWRSIDQKAVTNIARRFNAKITRVMKAHSDWAENLPERINVKELSEKLRSGTRREFNREMAKLERFLRKVAEMSIKNPGFNVLPTL